MGQDAPPPRRQVGESQGWRRGLRHSAFFQGQVTGLNKEGPSGLK